MHLHNITQSEKERFLDRLSEEEFREKIVRRLFKRLGFKDGRDLCGPEEFGRDAIFVHTDRFGETEIVAIQTKKGNLTMARDPKNNITEAQTQLRTALSTPYVCVETKRKIYPSSVYLIASGKINEHARQHILDQISDPRIKYLDRDDLINHIDSNCPEIWVNIVADVSPYLSALAKLVEESSVTTPEGSSALGVSGIFSAASDRAYIDVKLLRPTINIKTRHGEKLREYDFEEVDGSSLVKPSFEKTLLLGEAGTGKSTLLLRLAYLMAREGVKSKTGYIVPIYARALDILTLKDLGVIEVLTESVRRLTGLEVAPFTVDDLDEGRVIILIDGLDEIASQPGREAVIAKLNKIKVEYPRIKIVLTARPYGSIEKVSGIEAYSRLRISAISIKDAEKILMRFKQPGADESRTREVLRRLDNVHGMELNPLLVTVFALTTGADKKDLPANITELFSKFTELMLGRWDEKKGLGQQYQTKVKEHLLGLFCFDLQCNQRSRFTYNEFRDRISMELARLALSADLEIILSEILERSGLIRGSHDALEFRHQLIQEYFAAKGIPDVSFIKSVVQKEWWRNSIVFYFGVNPSDVNQLLDVATSSYTNIKEACITVGLALQTCYLSKIEDRIEVWKWVVESASHVTAEILKASDDQYPALNFLEHYLTCRDAVVLTGLEKEEYGAIQWASDGLAFTAGDPEIRRFWLLVALIEAGETAIVKELISTRPLRENRLNLALHLGCYFVRNVRAVDGNTKATAEEICRLLEERVAYLRIQLAREFHSHLLEYRRSGIVALDEIEPDIEAEGGAHLS